MDYSRKRILSVEDNDDICGLISFLLKSHEVISARNKTEALLLVATENFDLILLDCYLPDGSGFDVFYFVRATNNKTPIIFVTGAVEISEHKALALGAQGYINCSNLVEKLEQTVSNFL